MDPNVDIRDRNGMEEVAPQVYRLKVLDEGANDQLSRIETLLADIKALLAGGIDVSIT